MNEALAIQKGGVVLMPTETVYGLAADATNAEAVARIYEIKKRPQFNPLIVHVASLAEAEGLVREFPEKAKKLAQLFWPGPLTLVLPKNEVIPSLVTAGLDHVAIRIPRHPLALQLIEESKRPIAAPSANLYGTLSPTRLEDVSPEIRSAVQGELDGGPCAVGIESTIIGFFEDGIELLRPGGLPLEALEEIVGKLIHRKSEKVLAPGMVAHHYSPHTPLIYGWKPGNPLPTGRVGLIAQDGEAFRKEFAAVESLSVSHNEREAAANLFSALHRMDASQLDAIVALPFPERGLGIAINDRLRRAGSR